MFNRTSGNIIDETFPSAVRRLKVLEEAIPPESLFGKWIAHRLFPYSRPLTGSTSKTPQLRHKSAIDEFVDIGKRSSQNRLTFHLDGHEKSFANSYVCRVVAS